MIFSVDDIEFDVMDAEDDFEDEEYPHDDDFEKLLQPLKWGFWV